MQYVIIACKLSATIELRWVAILKS